MAVFASDVSGNRTTSKIFAVSTRNASPPNGNAATRDAKLRVSVTTSSGKTARQPLPYGRRVELRGTLSTADGGAIAGARVELSMKTTRPGAASHVLALTTGSHGEFAYSVAPGPSRTLDLGYRAFSADSGYAAQTSVKLAVRAGVTLKATPRTLRNRHRVRFSGRVLGGPRPQDASMILYALAPRGRIPVTSLRADSRGRFSFSYRFRTVTERPRFRFEVQVESRPSYPYAAGRSDRVAVVVRP